MSRGTRILCSIFGFYLTLALLAVQLCAGLSGYFLKDANLIRAVCTDASAEDAMALVLDEGTVLANANGISPSVLDGVFSKEQFLRDMTAVLENALAGRDDTPDTAQSMDKLAENVRKTLVAEGLSGDVSEYAGEIDLFCMQIRTIYEQAVGLRVYRVMDELMTKVRRVIPWALGAAAGLGVLCLALMGLVTRRTRRLGAEISYSVIAAGGLNALFAGGVLLSGVTEGLQLSPDYFRNSLECFLQNGLRFDLWIGLGVLAFGLVLFALSGYFMRRKK